MNCPQCGTPREANFCVKCGYKFPRDQLPAEFNPVNTSLPPPYQPNSPPNVPPVFAPSTTVSNYSPPISSPPPMSNYPPNYPPSYPPNYAPAAPSYPAGYVPPAPYPMSAPMPNYSYRGGDAQDGPQPLWYQDGSVIGLGLLILSAIFMWWVSILLGFIVGIVGIVLAQRSKLQNGRIFLFTTIVGAILLVIEFLLFLLVMSL